MAKEQLIKMILQCPIMLQPRFVTGRGITQWQGIFAGCGVRTDSSRRKRRQFKSGRHSIRQTNLLGQRAF